MLRNFLLIVGLFMLTATDNKPKWKSLFNGKDLDGWQVKIAGYPLGENFGNTFRVENGILQTRYNAYDSFRARFGALYYYKKFSNYRLKIEYRFTGELTPGAPSWGFRDGGVQYHCQSPSSLKIDQPFPVCLEYNLLGSNGKDERPTGDLCASGMNVFIDGIRNSSYCTPPTVKRTFHGDQWVTLEIDVRSDRIRHFVNGEEILQFENPRFNPDHALGKTFIVNNDDQVKEGYISLQSNSHPMDFRKIEILEYK
jgi:Domain of Unknown Function (DUF1080)